MLCNDCTKKANERLSQILKDVEQLRKNADDKYFEMGRRALDLYRLNGKISDLGIAGDAGLQKYIDSVLVNKGIALMQEKELNQIMLIKTESGKENICIEFSKKLD